MTETNNQVPENQEPETSTQETIKIIPSRSNDWKEGEYENYQKASSEKEIQPDNFKSTSSRVGQVREREGCERSSREEKVGYNFDECVQYLNKKGKEQYGNHFSIHPEDYEIIFKLMVYAIKDQKNAAKMNINLNKGILLSGPVGCGKTTLLTLVNYFQSRQNKHVMKTCREVSFEFIKEGYDIVHKYSTLSFGKLGNESWPRIYCFDDLGTENSLKYYGNECNVMAEILLSRYELFIHKKMLTHLTTNLSATEIENLYGSRVRSRMREMYNLIAFDKGVQDKRK